MILSEDYRMLFVANLHGYVEIWELIDSMKLSPIRRFRAHSEPIYTLSYSNLFRVLTTTATDGAIKVWSLDPFGYVGDIGKNFRWKLGNPETYKSTTALDDDPAHFVVVPEPTLPGTNSEKVRPTVFQQSPSGSRSLAGVENEEVEFDPMKFRSIMEEGERMVDNGMKWQFPVQEEKVGSARGEKRIRRPAVFSTVKQAGAMLKFFSQVSERKIWKPEPVT
jgi:hypothetical protein